MQDEAVKENNVRRTLMYDEYYFTADQQSTAPKLPFISWRL